MIFSWVEQFKFINAWTKRKQTQGDENFQLAHVGYVMFHIFTYALQKI